MQFVMLTDFAPMAIRKLALKYIGGMDEGLTHKGDCGIYSDWELVMRMWMAGWQVAYHAVSGLRGVQGGWGGRSHTMQ